jgi:hypothetical protein
MFVENFPKELADRIQEGLKHGVSEKQMIEGIVSMGNLLGRFVHPDSPEEALMKEMWDVSTSQEKHTLAELIFRVGKKRVQH